MKKIAIALVLALGLSFSGATAASAAENCVDKIVSPIIKLPIKVCVDVPLVPAIPPVKVPIVVPPVIVPPVQAPDPVKTSSPSKPAKHHKKSTERSSTPVVPAKPTYTKPHHVIQAPAAPVPSQRDRAESKFQELAFPFAFMLFLLAILFGGYQLFGYSDKRHAKKVARSENV